MTRTAGPDRIDTDDEEAQIAAARIDPQAFGPLYERYSGVVWRFVLQRLGNVVLAHDVTSQTFARAMAALPAYVDRGTSTGFRSWLLAIANNLAIDEVRRQRTVPLTADAASNLPDHRLLPEAEAVSNDERRRVAAAIGQLPPVQRQIVEARLAGMRSAEIAKALEMSVSAVNTAHFRAYTRLRDLLADDREQD